MIRPGKALRKSQRFWFLAPLILLILVTCDSPPPKSSINVVVIVMDAARRDRFSLYGYDRETSPNLSNLAATSTTYNNAYSTGGWTPPAHASLFTGLFPIAHQTTQEHWKMDDSLTTLAEMFKAEGYETIGIVENPMLNTRLNFDQGFSRYNETWRFPKEEENIAFSFFKKNLAGRKTERPFFMFINLIEPHSPYNSSEQFHYRFVSDRSVTIEENMWREFYSGKKTFTENEIRHLNELYDAEILYVDYVVGQMIEELKAKGIWEKTVFIVTSDHGENIGDHDMMDHVFSLHESIIRIPLIIHYPKLFPFGIRYDYPVQITDIFPTLLEIIGADAKRYPSQGRSLLGRKGEDIAPVLSEYYYPKQVLEGMDKKGLLKHDGENMPIDKYKRRIKALINKDMKLIWGSDGKHELYDLRKDPEEKENLIASQEYSQSARELLDLLNTLVKKYDLKIQKAPPAKDEEIDEETIKRLKSLGYVK
jgi:arylsulfatase A-like enzyme